MLSAIEDVGEHACVVAEQVDGAEGVVGLVSERVDGGAVGDVGLDGERLGAAFAQRVRDALGLVELDVGDHDTHPRGSAGARDPLPDAAPRAGDDGRPAFELFHVGLLARRDSTPTRLGRAPRRRCY